MPDPARTRPAPRSEVEAEGSKVDRAVSDTKSLSEDVAEWIRLKVQLIQIEVHERVSQEINAFFSTILVLGLLMIALLLILLGVSFYLGEVTGESGLGFAIVSAVIAIVAVVLGRKQPQWVSAAMFKLVPRRWLQNTKSKDDGSSESKA